MNKKEEKWRMEGASYALRIVREKGIDGLEQDLKMRGALNIPLTLKSKDLEEMYYQLARRIMNSIKTVAMWTLYEQGWRKTRLKRFEEQMDKHSAMCLEIDRYSYLKRHRPGLLGDISILAISMWLHLVQVLRPMNS